MLKAFKDFNAKEKGLFKAHFFSTVGERLSFITLLILSEELSGSSIGPMIVLSLYTATFLLVSTFSARIINNMCMRKGLILQDIIRSVLVLGFLLLTLNFFKDTYKIYFLYILLFLILVSTTIARNTFWAYIPVVVRKDKIVKFNSLISFSDNFGLAFGTAVGAFIVVSFGPGVIFLLDSLTYLLSAYFVIKLPSFSIKEIAANRTSRLAELVSGKIVVMLIMLIVVCTASGIVNTHTVLQDKINLFGDNLDKGILYSVLALGSWFSIYLAKVQKYIVFEGVVLLVTTYVCITSSSLWWVLSSLFICSALMTKNISYINTRLMNSIKPVDRGTFASLLMFVVRLFLFLGIWLYQL